MDVPQNLENPTEEVTSWQFPCYFQEWYFTFKNVEHKRNVCSEECLSFKHNKGVLKFKKDKNAHKSGQRSH